ncbi:MAG: hypothetical protein OXC72_11045 [Roseovarius sp.]|nr:hypothetical protein [Roseovarius sp.]MCY4292277.1 hypothetical protein [Roseovarius sp.]
METASDTLGKLIGKSLLQYYVGMSWEKWLFPCEMQAVERQIQGSEAGFRDFSCGSPDFRQFGPFFGPIRRIPDMRHRRPVSGHQKNGRKGKEAPRDRRMAAMLARASADVV